MGIKDFFRRQREEATIVEPPVSVTEDQTSFKQPQIEPAAKIKKEIDIPNYAVEQWSSAIFDDSISLAVKTFAWKNPTVEELTELIRSATNCVATKNDESVKISFLKYFMSVILDHYFNFNLLYNLSEDKREAVIKNFMMTLIQALADICTIFGIDLYNLFLSIKNVPVYVERQGDKVIEHHFKYSFRYFSKLWENSKSKFLLDSREKHIKSYEDIMGHFFEEFLENAETVDIEAIYKFSIQNEEFIETDFSSLIATSISNEYYDLNVCIGKGAVLAIARYYPDLLVNSYINRFNSIMFEMRIARDENDEEKIAAADEEMCQIIKTIADYQEYRSEEFIDYFYNTWEWFMGAMVDEFSGHTMSVFYDFVTNIVRIPQELVADVIMSDVLFLFVDYASGERISLNKEIFADAYRLLPNEIAFEAISMINPNLVNAF